MKKEEYKKIREIVNRELALWQKVYPKQSLLLDKYTTKLLVEIILQLEEKTK